YFWGDWGRRPEAVAWGRVPGGSGALEDGGRAWVYRDLPGAGTGRRKTGRRGGRGARMGSGSTWRRAGVGPWGTGARGRGAAGPRDAGAAVRSGRERVCAWRGGPSARTVGLMDADDDGELMLRYARGDLRAFEMLYQRHRGALYRYLSR